MTTNNHSHVGAICRECALAAGLVPEDKCVGVWTDECTICHERKPCTDASHDWILPANTNWHTMISRFGIGGKENMTNNRWAANIRSRIAEETKSLMSDNLPTYLIIDGRRIPFAIADVQLRRRTDVDYEDYELVIIVDNGVRKTE